MQAMRGSVGRFLSGGGRLQAGVTLVGVAALLAGCASGTGIEDPRSWPAASMDNAEFQPSAERLDPASLNRRTRVIILQPKDSASQPRMGLADHAQAGLESVLSREGGAETVDRSMGDRLGKELELIEMRGTSNKRYDGPAVADFAVTVSLGAASWSSRYQQAVVAPPKDGKPGAVLVPAGFVNAAKSAMSVRLYELPSMRMVMQEVVEGEISHPGQPLQLTPNQVGQLLRDATTGGIEKVKGKLLTELSPRGYIVDRRAKDKKSIFRALISSQTGAKEGDTVEIFTLRQEVIEIGNSRRTTMEEVKVATGCVTSSVQAESSWVIVHDEAAAARVRKGDVVRVRHSNASTGVLPGAMRCWLGRYI